MITAPDGVEFRPLTFPPSVDDPHAADFVAMALIRNLVYAEVSGHDDHRMSPAELLPNFAPDPAQLRYVWLVLVDGDPVGRIGVDIPQEAGSRIAYWLIELRRSVWGRGIGSAALALVEDTARAHGRTVLQTWAEHPPAAGERLEAPTGYGSIPRDHIARFLLKRQYRLEQVVRVSALDLSGGLPRVREMLEKATEAAAGYRVVQWRLPTPPEFADGYAWMKSRMNTDAPAAGLDFDEETWDAERVARHDATIVDAGRTALVTAAQHLDTGDLVAFNELVVNRDLSEATHQYDTLVLSDHRGHRLGMLVKCAGLLAWREVAPRSPRVITYNAEENRPMLDINEAIGFAPIAYEGAWKRVLTDS
ncbi:GNAT family N-acetyltransferase [Microbacterium sp. P06]|uniref:GNAT family N-acetyltransferase n=1 Tax=Microbacterium sp. P06 TaxID=3366949 RepID=UPI003746EFD0